MQDKVQKISPKIRFKGYTDDWELRKLGEVAHFGKGRGYKKEDLLPNGTPIILYGSLYTNYKTIISNIITFAKVKDNSIISTGNEVIVPASGETSEEISRASVVSEKGIILGGDLNIIKVTTIDPIFLAITISNGRQKKELVKRAQGKSVVHLHNDDLRQVNLYCPSIEEQQAIGLLFKKLDDLIALQQRKIDTLKLLEKALLQQMFPKKGKDMPSVRFANFNEIYQQRKLKELLIKNSKKNKNLSISNVESVSNKVGFIKQTEQFEDYSVASSNLSNYYVITPKQFAYNPSRINVGSIAYKKEKDDISVVSPLYVSFSTKNTIIDDNYLWFWFKTSDFERQRQKYSEGGVRDTLSFNQLSEMKLMLPNIKEQKLFGEFVKKSEYHLKLIEQKFNGLKTIKKALLQKMFT